MQNSVNLDQIHNQKIVPMLIVLAICGGNLFHNETVDGKNNLSYTLTQRNIGLTYKLAFDAFEGNKDGVTTL